MLVEVSDSSVEFMNITFSFYINSKYWLCNDDGKFAGICIQGLHVHYRTMQVFNMSVPLDVPLASRYDIRPSQDCVSAPKCRDKKHCPC